MVSSSRPNQPHSEFPAGWVRAETTTGLKEPVVKGWLGLLETRSKSISG